MNFRITGNLTTGEKLLLGLCIGIILAAIFIIEGTPTPEAEFFARGAGAAATMTLILKSIFAQIDIHNRRRGK